MFKKEEERLKIVAGPISPVEYTTGKDMIKSCPVLIVFRQKSDQEALFVEHKTRWRTFSLRNAVNV